MSILTGIDDIQVMLDDYLLRIQTMRGSPFIGAIESEVECWEDKLILMQDILDLWLQVSSLYKTGNSSAQIRSVCNIINEGGTYNNIIYVPN